ncbi:MAG: hypothetical protein ACQETQ_02905 [Spirochaetota bacterium]
MQRSRNRQARNRLVIFAAVLGIVLLLTGLPSAFGEPRLLPEDVALIPSPRLSSMGGTHAALSDDISTFFSNPAGFRSAEPTFQAAELGIRLSGPAFTLANLVAQGSQEDIEDVLTSPDVADLFSSLYTDMTLVGPISYGFVGDGLGFIVSNNNGLSVESRGSSTLGVDVYQRLVLAGGFGLNIPFERGEESGLDIGLLLKGFFTGRSGLTTGVLELPDTLSSFGPGTVMDEPFDLTTGMGLDLGVSYTPVQPLTLGLTAQNLLAPAIVNEYTSLQAFLDDESPTDRVRARIPQNVSFGMMYRPELGPVISRHIDDLKLLFDYRDIFDFWIAPRQAENIVLKFSVGTEITLLRVLDLRAGLAQGLPAAGLGLDFQFMEFDVAMYGSELSTEPGFRSVYNVALGFRFAW